MANRDVMMDIGSVSLKEKRKQVEIILEEIMIENFPGLKKNTNTQFQELQKFQVYKCKEIQIQTYQHKTAEYQSQLKHFSV